MLVPGTTKRYLTAIRPVHLQALMTGMARIVRESGLSRGLRTSEEICDQHGVKNLGDRVKVRKLLKALVESSKLKGERTFRRQAKGNRSWLWPYLFDPDEVNGYLAGQN